MKQETPMQLTIHSRLTTGGETETVLTEARGVLRQVGDHASLAYTERREGGARVMTTLSWQAGTPRVRLTHRGDVRWEVDFDPRMPAVTRYEVPPYTFELSVRCHEIRLPLDENGGEIHLTYTRNVGGDEALVELTLTARVREEELP